MWSKVILFSIVNILKWSTQIRELELSNVKNMTMVACGDFVLVYLKRHRRFEITQYNDTHSCVDSRSSQDHDQLDPNLLLLQRYTTL